LGALFFKFEARQTAIIVSAQQRAATPNLASSNFKKKCANCHFYLQQAVTDGHHCPLKTYYDIFSRAEKPNEDITWRLYLMNMKGF
jgi:hypothetical protein